MINIDREASSLDRFLLNRAPALIGLSGARASVMANGALGVLFSLTGLGFIIGGIATHQPEMAYSSAGPLFGGVVNLMVAGMMRKRVAHMDPANVKLSSEAKEFLHKLMRQAFGWRYAWVGWDSYRYQGLLGRRRRHLRSVLWGRTDASADQRPAAELLRPELFALLDEAAQHFNRIQGCLTVARTDAGGALKKMRPAIVEAADETMAEVLHQAALMENYPESNTQGTRIVANRVAALRETADRVEAMQAREPSLMERMAPSSTMDSVLEELRMEEIARTELQTPEAKRQDLGQSNS